MKQTPNPIKRPTGSSPIPSHAKKVFQGEIFEVWQWSQELYDGSFVTYEKIKRLDSVNIIPITKNGQIIITQQQQSGRITSFVGLPGGIIDQGESPLEAAQRELAEETGYTSNDWELWTSLQPISKIDWAIYTFIARNCHYTHHQNLDAGEKITLQLVNFNQFLQLIKKPDFRDREISFKLLTMNRQELHQFHKWINKHD